MDAWAFQDVGTVSVLQCVKEEPRTSSQILEWTPKEVDGGVFTRVEEHQRKCIMGRENHDGLVLDGSSLRCW